ncbi:hypothetical protein [Paenibacillus oceani]|uniref:Uncharacterized protein n=1 Tax=Paenibacillus oceani TaxID=2772510 RepID=A0A927C7J6_9BACL|nr:hypothetical protein [Paenibacillus oceani]MBD2861593.1 hypothetical protein [Paenibacillus oceani]
MAWQTPKTDWKFDDFYNFGDLDRVESNTAHVAATMTTYGGGQPVTVVVVTNRNTSRFEFFDSMNRIEGNLNILADNFYRPTGWENPKTNWASGQAFSWRDARRLENNLLIIYDLLLKSIDSFKYCGTFSCGEDGDIY